MMQSPGRIAFVVDDDNILRHVATKLLERSGIDVIAFTSAADFLAGYRDQRGCLLLDINMPEMTGLELQTILNERGSHLPIIFLTGCGNVPMAVNAIKAGAIDFLEKPVDHGVLISKVSEAFEREKLLYTANTERAELCRKLGELTERERQIMNALAKGNSNKEIARIFGIGVRTVETHRANLMEKLSANSIAEVVRLALLAEKLPQATPSPQ